MNTSLRSLRQCRWLGAILIVASFCVSSTASAQDVAWAVVDVAGQPDVFTPSNQYRSSGGPITVRRILGSPYIYRVTVPGVTSADGFAHIQPMDSSSLVMLGSPVPIILEGNLVCDVLMDTGSRFVYSYHRGTDNSRRDAYVYSGRVSVSSTTPTTFTPAVWWNGLRGAPEIRHTARGVYDVRLPGLGTSVSGKRGHVQLTSTGSAWLGGWSDLGSDMMVRVFFNEVESWPHDFMLTYNESAAPIDPTEGSGAYVWAHSPTASSYTPDSRYSDSNGTAGPPGAAMVVTRLGLGRYRVDLPGVAPSDRSIALATAYDLLPRSVSLEGYRRAQVDRWESNGRGGTFVFVSTTDYYSVPTDCQFNLLFLNDRPAASQTVGWAYVNPKGMGSLFWPSASYQHNPSGAAVEVQRDPIRNNRFKVLFPGLAPSSGVVHTCAYGGNHTAVVNSWGNQGTTVYAWVELFTPTGAPANDGSFTIHYRRGGNRDDREAYVWASQPTSTSYTPTWSWNHRRGNPTILRLGTGQYQVRVPKLGVSASGERGHVQVTPYASTMLRAKVAQWNSFGDELRIDVRCHDAAGALTDGRFVLSYNERAAPIARREGSGAHVWAGEPTTASYAPHADYTDSNGTYGPLGAERVTRLATGSYRVDLPNVAPADSSTALVTAYGTTAHYASIASWAANGTGTSVFVRTYTAAGAAANAQFTLFYLTNHSGREEPGGDGPGGPGAMEPGSRHRAFGTGCGGMILVGEPDPMPAAAAGTTLSWTVHGAPPVTTGASTSFGWLFLGLHGNPGRSLAPLGALDCFGYLDSVDAALPFFTPAGARHTATLAMPPGMPCGLPLFAQAAALADLNSLGVVLSNGVESRSVDS